MKNAILEICVESLESAIAAEAGGADRIELCEHLVQDGFTPNPELIRQVIDAVHIPVCILIRPQKSSFVYNLAELDQMRAEIEFAKLAGASSVMLGVLKPDLTVDVDSSRELIMLARPMEVTFHRAFDVVADQRLGLEDVIKTGAEWLLTSGGAPNVLSGAETIAELHKLSAGRIQLMVGGGLRIANLLEVRRMTGVNYLHSSLVTRPELIETNGNRANKCSTLDKKNVREALRLLHQELQMV